MASLGFGSGFLSFFGASMGAGPLTCLVSLVIFLTSPDEGVGFLSFFRLLFLTACLCYCFSLNFSALISLRLIVRGSNSASGSALWRGFAPFRLFPDSPDGEDGELDL